jgi:hypothetical protein
MTRSEALVEVSLLRSAGLEAWSPELTGFAAYPNLEVGSFHQYRLLVTEPHVEAARDFLAASGADVVEPPFSCPQCGGRSRRLRRVLAITAVFLFLDGFYLVPILRRKRICTACRRRFLPAKPDAFTEEELGYRPPDGKFSLAAIRRYLAPGALEPRIKALLGWTRSVGYEPRDEMQASGEHPDEPSRDL